MKFPVDAPQRNVLRAFEQLSFVVVRKGNHIVMERKNSDGTVTPLRGILTQSGIDREEFLRAYSKI
jgi:hypothetical protein